MKSKTKRQINKFTALCLITTLILSVFSMIPRTASAKELSQFELEDLQQEGLYSIQSTGSLVDNSTISTNRMVVGNTVEMQAVGSGGTAPYTYVFYYKTVEASTWKTLQNYSEKDTATLTLSVVGTYDICIKVKDSTGKIVKKYFTLTVVDGPLATKSYLSSDKIQLGQFVFFNLHPQK